MKIDATITLFEVQRCGYYKYPAEYRFGSLQTLLEDMSAWSSTKTLAQTKIFEVDEGEDIDPVHLFSITKSRSTGNWLVVTWNQVQTIDGKIASVPGSAKVGSATVESSDVKEGNIPGYPTFFYIFPDKNIIATVRLFTSKIGRVGLQSYLKTFLALHTRHVVFERTNDDGTEELRGYRESDSRDVERLSPTLRMGPIRKLGRLDEIRNRCDEIRRVVRKASLDLRQHAERDLWQTMLAKLGKANSNVTTQTIDVKYEFNTSVSLPELEQMIRTWENERKTTWDDIGFLFKGETGSPLWLSNSTARDTFRIDVHGNEDGNVDEESLLSALDNLHQAILQLR